MSAIETSQIVYWDETHRKVVVGSCKNFTYRFKRSVDGLLDNTGEYGPESVCLNIKYTNAIRVCVGVAKVELDSGKIIGRRAKTYSYSGKVILSKNSTTQRFNLS